MNRWESSCLRQIHTCWHTQNEWWIKLEQQNWKRKIGTGWGEKTVEGNFIHTHTQTKNWADIILAGSRSPECWGCVLQVSGEAGRGLSASDFLSYPSFSSSLTPVIHLLLPYPTSPLHLRKVSLHVEHSQAQISINCHSLALCPLVAILYQCTSCPQTFLTLPV